MWTHTQIAATTLTTLLEVLYGIRAPNPLQSFALRAQGRHEGGCSLRFYTTKYHAKAQQVLASALPWLMQGIQRCKATDLANEEPNPLREMALKRLRRLMFAANRCHWFSATELSILIFTDGACIQTHSSSRAFACRLYSISKVRSAGGS